MEFLAVVGEFRFAVVFLGSVFLRLSPVIYVILAAVAGILLKRLEVKA